MTSPLKQLMDSWPLPDGEPFPGETLRADGWLYIDLPRMPPANFDKFVTMVGEDNIRWLTIADYGKSKRGQCFVSPAGIDNVKTYVASKRDES